MEDFSFRLLEPTDLGILQDFCNACKKLGYKNNESFASIKLDKMTMPFGRFFIGYDNRHKKIFTLAGIHKLDEVNDRAWRCLFRGATLPGYTMSNGLSKNFFQTMYQFKFILPLQIEYIKNRFINPEFYITTVNAKNNTDDAGKSKRMSVVAAKTMAKKNIIEKVKDDIILYYTNQTLWKINLTNFYKEKELHAL